MIGDVSRWQAHQDREFNQASKSAAWTAALVAVIVTVATIATALTAWLALATTFDVGEERALAA